MTKNGIDVSEWQGSINWTNVTTDFCIIRAGYGRYIAQKDKRFEENYAGCSSKGIPCGTYWYSYAVTPEEAVLEAQVCLEAIRGKQFEYPVYFDIEEQRQFSLGRERVSAIIRAFLTTVEQAGYWVGLYTNKNALEQYVDNDIRTRYAVWVAQYGVSAPTYNGVYGMWQKSSTGRIDGISGNVDLDESYVDYPSLIREAGLNGFAKGESRQVTLTIDGQTYSGTLFRQ